MVAGRLWPLRPLFHSECVSQRSTYRIGERPRRAGARRNVFARLSTLGRTTCTADKARVCCADQAEVRQQISWWADLMILAGTSPSTRWFKILSVSASGRADVWDPKGHLLSAHKANAGGERYSGDRDLSKILLAAVQMVCST